MELGFRGIGFGSTPGFGFARRGAIAPNADWPAVARGHQKGVA